MSLPEGDRRAIQQKAVDATDSEFVRERIRRKGIAQEVTSEVLQEFANQNSDDA